MGARIVSTGSYLPSKLLTNQQLQEMVHTSDEWIKTRTGIERRRIAGEKEATSDMAVAAARIALERAHFPSSALDLIVVATVTPDLVMPSCASFVQQKLEAPQAAIFDLNAACTGFLYALSVAKAYVESGMYKNILVIGAEKLTPFIDYQDRSSCVLFGDGAAAALVRGEGRGLWVQEITLGGDGRLADLIKIPAGGSSLPPSLETVKARQHYFCMEGRKVFKSAVRQMKEVSERCMEKAGILPSQLSWLVPHQANRRIIDAVAKSLGCSEDTVCWTLKEYGNTSAASVPITLDELVSKTSLREGAFLLLLACGAGLTWGASVLKQVETT